MYLHKVQPERWDLLPYSNIQLKRVGGVRCRLAFMRNMGVLEEPIWNGLNYLSGNLFTSKPSPSHHYIDNFLLKAWTQHFISICIVVKPQEFFPILYFPFIFIFLLLVTKSPINILLFCFTHRIYFVLFSKINKNIF